MVTFAGDHLGSCVAGGATGCLERLAILVHVRESKIHNLDVVLVIKQQVLRLQIPMADLDLVDVLDAGDDLLDEPASFLLLETLTLDNVVEELAP